MSTAKETKALLQKAEQLIEEKKYNEVKDLLTDEILEQHKSAELFTEKARAHGRLKEWDEQKKYLDKAFTISDKYFKTFFSRGYYWVNQGEYDKAIEDYTKTIELKPDYAEAYYSRGIQWHNKGESDKAFADYDKAIELKPDNADAYNNRGLIWDNKGESDKAFADYDKAIELKPHDEVAYCNRGITWIKKGVNDIAIANYFTATEDFNKANADFDKAIELKPDYAMAYYNRGFSWKKQWEIDKANADYDKAIELKPDYADAYFGRGNAWLDEGAYDKAIENFDKVIEFQPDYAMAYHNRGFTWDKKRESDKAIDDYTKAIELKPDFANPYWGRADVYSKLEEYDKAVEDYTKAIELNTNFSFLQNKIDEVKLKQGEIIEKTEASQNEATLFISDILEEITNPVNKQIIREKSVAALDSMRKIQNHCAIEKPIDVVHYSKLFVADLFLNDANARQRYGNVVNMNDPEEGRILSLLLKEKDDTKTIETYLEETRLFEDGDSRHNNIYLGSFLPAPENDSINSHEDELIMWRTYGKDENKNEAAGCSIVIAPEFFFWPPKDDSSHTVMQKMENAKPAAEKKIKGEVLHRVLYYDKVKKAIVRNDDFDCNEINNEMGLLVEVITDLINLRTNTKEDKKIDDIIYRILSELRHNFKGASYAFENEYRVIIYCEPDATIEGENIVKVDMNSKQLPRSFYIESANNIGQYIRKIYIGPKVPNPERWMYLEVVAKQKGLTKLTVQASGQKFQ